MEKEYFGWQSPFILGIKDNHLYKIVELSSTKSKIVHSDECIDGGLLAGLLGNKISKKLMVAMQIFNEELKKEIEIRYQ